MISKSLKSFFFIFGSTVIFLVLFFLNLAIFRLPLDLLKFLHLPAYVVNGQIVSAVNFNDELEAFYKRQADLSDNRLELFERSLTRKLVIIGLAKKENVKVEPSDIVSVFNDIKFTPKEVAKFENLVNELYGWEGDEFISRVLYPYIQTIKLAKQFEEEANREVKDKMNNYLTTISVNPEKFEEIAGQVNEDETKYTGGYLGLLKLNETIPEFESVLLNLSPGQLSRVVGSRFGYHIVKLHQRITEPSLVFEVSHIFRKRKLFEDYLAEQINRSWVLNFVR